MSGPDTPDCLDASPHQPGPSVVVRVATVLLMTLVAGVVLWAVADATSRTDVGGPGWSLKGNGALAVPFGLGPAVLASAWVALSHAGLPGARREHVVLAGLTAFVLSFAVVFGPFLPLGFWPALFAPVLALAIGHSLARIYSMATGLGLVAGVTLVALYLAGVLSQPNWTAWAYQLAPLMVPVAESIPLGLGMLSGPGNRTEHAWKLGGCLLVPFVLLVGLVGTSWIIAAVIGPR